MKENTYEAQYDVTKKSRLKQFYDSYKILIYSFLITIFILFGAISYYLDSIEKKKILYSENYIQAKIYLENGNKQEALSGLREIVFFDDSTYSPLAFFLILDQNLIKDPKEILDMYDHLLENNKFDKELKNLLIYKKALFSSDFIKESELLEITKPLLNSDSMWKAHTLLLLGDYFMSKKESIKAIEFYQKILSIENLHKDLYLQARSQLNSIVNE
tara:strand:+ start:247 stop:894 length:648 start_codon:yes stop_codon:yes gene_type:complete